MTIIAEWTPSSRIDTNLTFLMKSQPVYRGVIIHHEGNYAGQPEWSPRRYSIIEVTNGEIYLIVGSIAYKSRYDSEDPLEPLKKYASEEWKDLMVRKFDGPILEAYKWDGRATTINDSSFGE